YFSLALKADGTVWGWGGNGFGQLGDGTTTLRTTPVQVRNLTGAGAIAAGGYHSLALVRYDGAVWAWGWNGSGQLGLGNNTDSVTPLQVPGLSGVSSLSGGGYHSLALARADGSIWAWGDNGDGELGLGNNSNAGTNSPQKIPGLSGVVQMSSG